MEVIELKVRLHCQGCKKKVEKAVKGLKGVENVSADLKTGKVTVMGTVDKEEVLKRVRKTGRSAEYLMPAYVVGYNPYTLEGDKFQKTHNYEENGYNKVPNPIPGPASILPSDGPAGMFHEENTNACSIM